MKFRRSPPKFHILYPYTGMTCGYTGHEMLDTVDIVHKNRRDYHTFLGRVLSLDLFVQPPFDM